MIKNKFIICKVLIVLYILFIFSILTIPVFVSATEEQDTWAIPMGSKNDYQMTISVDDEKIKQQGFHVRGKTNVLYRTIGFYMTLKECESTFTKTDAYEDIEKRKIVVKVKNDYDDETVKTTYSMKKSDFIDAMMDLGVTSQKIKNNGGYITVYLNNIFEIFNPSKEGEPAYKGYTNIFGYKEMIHEGDKITGYNGGWSHDTREILKSYYNFSYKVYPTLFNVQVIAVDTEGNELGTLRSNVGMFNEKYPLDSACKAPDTYIASNGVNYHSQNYWYCKYTSRIGRNTVTEKEHTGNVISDKHLPDAAKNSTVYYYMVYDKKPSASVFMNAVEKDDPKHIISMGIYIKNVTASENFVQPDFNNPKTIKHDGATYKKTIHYTYKYNKQMYPNDKKGTEVEISGTSQDWSTPVWFQVPDDVVDKSTITVSVYYDKGVTLPGDIPISVIAVDKDTGKKLLALDDINVKENDTYKYAVPESILTNTYTYTGSWEWSYQKNTATAPTESIEGSGNVNFIAPLKAQIKDKITVKVYYTKVGEIAGNLTLRVIMVNSTGKLIKEISKETVTTGKSISKTTEFTKSVNGVKYKYLDKWDYDYTSSSATNTKSGTGLTAIFTIPSNANQSSIVTLRFYYDSEEKPPVIPPEPEAPISVPLDSPDPEGIINGDTYNSPYFLSKQGIATTESQYVSVKTKDYLLGYTLVNRTGKVTYYVPVTMHYTLQYKSATPGQYGGAKTVTEEVKDTQKIKIERTYSYWEITKLEYYYVKSAEVYNYSLPKGNVRLSADDSMLNIPSISTWHSEDLKDHVFAPRQVEKGINVTADKPITSDTSVRPTIDYEDLTVYAEERTEQTLVRNDYLMFDGGIVLSDDKVELKASHPNVSSLRQCNSISKDKALFTHGQVIDAEKENGNYPSTGSVTYHLNPNSINTSYSTKAFNVSVNPVIIHTPVICDPDVNANNEKWVQLINPQDSAIQIVLDPDRNLNDFSVKISNILLHSNRLGYYTRDFSKSFIDPENVSYIAQKSGIIRNEMQLPFDVYIDIFNDNDAKNDQFIKAGTWIVLGRAKARLYVPMWVQEDTYTAHFRTIAVNGTDKCSMIEKTRNSEINNYVATYTKTFQVSGRIYGLTLYDISDYPKWQDVFRKDGTMLFKCFEGAIDGTAKAGYNKNYAYNYTVGIQNQYGNNTGRFSKYTFPLVNNSHPKYKNLGVLKTGYAVRFMLDTIGEMYSSGCHIKITPTFYYVDKDGKHRQQVDLYYKEEIKDVVYPIVKVGIGIDLVNIQSGKTGNIYSRIPKAELKQNAKVLDTTYSKVKNQMSTMYSYSQIKLLKGFRTFIGNDYASFITGLDSFTDVSSTTTQNKTSLSKYMQRWYGTYKIPTNVHAVKSSYDVFGYLKKHGIDYREDFWLRGGYIIVNFDIVTIDHNGKKHLSYINADNYLHNNNCSMWVTEGAIVQKTDYKDNTFNFKAGDFVIYYTDKKASDDYSGGLY